MILDYIENLVFNPNEEGFQFDIEMTLAKLSQGLFWLYRSVENIEKVVQKRARDQDVIYDLTGGLLEGLPTEWLSCAFQWYSVSLYNYVRLAYILTTNDPSSLNRYIDRVMPVAAKYRHTVAAHFSYAYPKNDNEADRISSIMTNVIYAQKALRAGAMSEILKDENGKDIEVSYKKSWSLTHLHAKLIPRYWPNGPIKAFGAIKMPAHSTRRFRIDDRD